MTDPQIAILMMVLFIFIIMLGYPIAFTLVAMGVFFGYYAMEGRIFDLLVQNTYDIMANDILVAVPLFLFMGYIVERANIIDRLFYSIQLAARHVPTWASQTGCEARRGARRGRPRCTGRKHRGCARYAGGRTRGAG
jgi:TRAP-type mannitol/chloroaromatic compound transport system permease large subunit